MRVAIAIAVLLAAPVGAIRHLRRARDTSVPVLEYHVIGVPPAPGSITGLYVRPAAFRAQVAWLAAHGWHPVTLDRVLAHWRHGAALPRRPVVLTFDDGYAGDWRYALPVLRAHRWPAVLNLQIGNLVPRRVRELLRAGWQLASHTFTHPDLTTVDAARLRREVLDSRLWLQNVFHVRVDTFCYPFGRYDAGVVDVVRAAGYAAAETERPGWASPRDGLLKLHRIRVTAGLGVAGLAGALGEMH